MQSILRWDLELFRLINYQWHNRFFDTIMPFFRNAPFWNPLYFFLIVFAIVNFKQKAWWWIVFAMITAIITNYISSDIIKEHIIRLRPCNDVSIANWVRVLVSYRPQSSSFTSSHAANHFGMAFFLYVSLKKQFKYWPALFFVWAFCICYAQIYVGVHYPLDIAGGAFIGLVIGYLSGKMFNKYFGLT